MRRGEFIALIIGVTGMCRMPHDFDGAQYALSSKRRQNNRPFTAVNPSMRFKEIYEMAGIRTSSHSG
jgi:hypothetical protein